MSEAKLSAVIRDPTGQAELELPSRVVDQFSVDQTLNFLVKLNLQSGGRRVSSQCAHPNPTGSGRWKGKKLARQQRGSRGMVLF